MSTNKQLSLSRYFGVRTQPQSYLGMDSEIPHPCIPCTSMMMMIVYWYLLESKSEKAPPRLRTDKDSTPPKADAAGWTRIAFERATCPTRLFQFSNFREQYFL